LIGQGGGQGDDLHALAQGGRTNVAGFFVRLIARIPFLLIAGRWYGAGALGRMAYAVVAIEFAAQLATLGLKRGLALHLTGDGKESGVWDGLVLAILVSLPLCCVLLIFPQIMFPNSEFHGAERLMALVVILLAPIEVMLAALAYRFNVKAAVRARSVVEPWAISIGAFAFSWYSLRDGLLMAYAAAMFASFVAATIPFFRAHGLPRDWRPRIGPLYRLAERNVPLALADGIEWGSRRLDIAILGLFVSPATVGIYYVAQQVASLPQKLKSSFDPVLGPVVARKLAIGDRAAVARQISQVGFWIISAQAGIALALGIPGGAIMGLVGSKGAFVGGATSLFFLLMAEVAAAVAVVSEAALVYVARHQNLMVSMTMIGLQAVLTFGLITILQRQDFPETWLAAAPALVLAIVLGLASIVKSWLAARVLGAPVSVLRWPLAFAAAIAALVGAAAGMGPEWVGLGIGLPAILLTYGCVIWRYGFRQEDRILFRKTQPDRGGRGKNDDVLAI
jgi:O-antigen/teichoic acid export membrane protein